jgi:hypothetical protein
MDARPLYERASAQVLFEIEKWRKGRPSLQSNRLAEWKLHEYEDPEIICLRSTELSKKGEFVAQAVVRLKTKQVRCLSLHAMGCASFMCLIHALAFSERRGTRSENAAARGRPRPTHRSDGSEVVSYTLLWLSLIGGVDLVLRL